MNNQQINFHRPDRINDTLYVIAPVFNPKRYRSRWKLYQDFERYVLMNKEAHLVTVECTFGDREEAIAEQVDYNHTIVKLTSKNEIWIKENMINLAIQRLPEDWKYVAWIDADIQFIRPDWVGECIHQLQHHPIIQMFSVAWDIDPNYVPYQMHTSFGYDYRNDSPPNDYYKKRNCNSWHTGYAWAATREAISNLGGLIDWAVLGAADNHMARALIGKVHESYNEKISQEYKDMLHIWQDRATEYIKGNLGYMDGGLLHYFHGAKVNRRYHDRWQILVKNDFQPSLDLKKDWNGLYQLTDRTPKLRRDIQLYFKQRDEDNIDMKGVKTLF
jgi:glycosyltransferase involved in cell wall biosynthesis